MDRLGLGVTLLKEKGGYSGESKPVLYSLISRFEIAELKSIIDEIDEKAFVTISNIHEVMGGDSAKKEGIGGSAGTFFLLPGIRKSLI